jgi:hypothetical protein
VRNETSEGDEARIVQLTAGISEHTTEVLLGLLIELQDAHRQALVKARQIATEAGAVVAELKDRDFSLRQLETRTGIDHVALHQRCGTYRRWLTGKQ